MDKIKILAIAPYEGLKEILNKVASSRNDVELIIRHGDLYNGLNFIEELKDCDYDIILSRGGTAELIASNVNIPVIDIKTTVYDLLRVIHLTSNYTGKLAIVGFSSVTNNADTLFEIIEKNVDIFTIKSEENAHHIIEKLSCDGYTLIIGDTIAASIAKKNNINAILITSGIESVNIAIDLAIWTMHVITNDRKNNLMYKNILDESEIKIILTDDNANIIYSNINIIKDKALYKYIKSLIPIIIDEAEIRKFKKINGLSYQVLAKRTSNNTVNKGSLINFYIKLLADLTDFNDRALQYYDIEDNYGELVNDYPIDNFGIMDEIHSTAYKFIKSNISFHIETYQGADIDNLILYLHKNSNYCNNSLLYLDCGLLNKKAFLNLLHNENSPFNEINILIYIKNIDELDKQCQREFFTYSENSSLHKRNQIIYSYKNDNISETLIHSFNCDNCPTIRIPLLNERKIDIPALACLYIDYYNNIYGKHIIGFKESADCINYLCNFNWQYNIEQLRRVIKTMVILTDIDKIQLADLIVVLEKERHLYTKTNNINLNGTFEDISKQIVQVVLEEEGMNKAKTSKRLGIGRSTLWRILKNKEK